MRRVIQIVHWPHIRFTGVIFTRALINDSTPDGVPSYASAWQHKADCVLVDIPMGILRRAQERVKKGASSSQQDALFLEITKSAGLCAVYELYGSSKEEAEGAQKILNNLEEDLKKQIITWSDTRLSYRTETNINTSAGADLFHDNFVDFDL